MDNLQRQYRQELICQEMKANERTLKGFVWFLLATAFMWVLTVIGLFQVDLTLITIAFISTAVLFIPAFVIYNKGDLSSPWLKYVLLSLICVASGVICAFLSFHAVLLYVVPLLFAIQYRRSSTIWFAYAVNTVTMLISMVVSFYYGICDLNLLFESRHVRQWYLNMLAAETFSIPLNENPVFVIIVFGVFPRSVILFLYSVMMQYTIVSSNEDAFRIAQLTCQKETDRGTKVFNKNKYEEMAMEYYPQIAQIAVLFWDINNLKVINDQYGHAMGDKVITKFSATLDSCSNDGCRVYRIGGDEFVMVIDNADSDEAERVAKDITEKLATEIVEDQIKISSAVGWAVGKGRDLHKIVDLADAKMYRNKKNSKANRI